MTGVPYLGSKISLISKSEIRYEGILYAVDTKESTVALAKVKSFGTERRQVDIFVEPRNEVHEYIIFRAGEIKDLHVCEPPKSQQSGLLPDPAIVEQSPEVSTRYSLPFGQSYATVIPPFQHVPTQTTFSRVPSYYQAGHISGPSRSTTPTSQRKSPTTDAGVQVSGVESASSDFKESRNEQMRQRPREQMQDVTNSGPQRQMPMNRRGQNRGRGAPRRGWGRGRGGSNFREVLKFDNEYDFEQANAEFQELETKLAKVNIDVATESEPKTETDDSGTYDRKKSFFDDISCDSSERSKGLPRFDWRIERKLNVETFGVSTSNTWFRRRRGRGGYRRGYRSRGGSGRFPFDNQKTVTFDDKPTIKEMEVIEAVEAIDLVPESKPEEIPVIELVVEKEKKDWPEPSDKEETVWD